MANQTISRDELAALFEQLAAALRDGGASGDELPAQAAPGTARSEGTSSPAQPRRNGTPPAVRSWRKVGELDGQSYTWPSGPEEYEQFEVWEANDPGERLQLGLGYVPPDPAAHYYGRPRGYWLAFEMINGQKRRPLVVFIEADNGSDVVAVIKGKGPGGRSMYAPGDELPPGYDGLTVDIFRDRVTGPQAYGRLAVVAENGDRQAMLNHAAIQSRLRG